MVSGFNNSNTKLLVLFATALCATQAFQVSTTNHNVLGKVGSIPSSSSKRYAVPLIDEVANQASLLLSTTTATTEALATTASATTSSWISQAAAVAAAATPGAVDFGLWFAPVLFYLRGYPLTAQFVEDLEKMDPTDPEYDPSFKPVAPQWDLIEHIPGGKDGVLQHIKWGSPSLAMYLLASFGYFPGHESDLFLKASAVLVIPAGLTLWYCLLGAFKVLGGLYKQNQQTTALVFATTLIVLTTLPFFQLVTWEIEYALRFLLDTPTQAVLPDFILTIVSKTNIMLPLFVGPLTGFFNWDVFPQAFSTSGVAVVQSIVDANQYLQNPAGLTPEILNSINSGLLVQVLYGSLAIIPMWATLTNFGFADVNTPFSRCAFSKAFLAIINKENWAQEGVVGMIWLYWILSFAWLLWGVEINAAYMG